MRIEGFWHRSGSAARTPATLTGRSSQPASDDRESPPLALEAQDGTVLLSACRTVSVSDRLGNVERTLTFDDGSVFTTRDNDAVDAAFRHWNPLSRGVHSLESSKRWILVALTGTLLFGVAFVRWGIPWASLQIAQALPQRAGEIISSSTLDFLDEWFFEETTLDADTVSRIERHFRSQLLPLDERNDGIRYRLLFRDWTLDGEEIPNALALPSGDIVLTDAFVRLCESQEEMDSVILHEIGHVVERHSLQRIVEASFVATAVMLVTGDGTALSDLGVGLGTLLVNSHYSRRHEAAADRYAFDRMLVAGIDPVVFGHIMARMTASVAASESGDGVPDSGDESAGDDSTRPGDDQRGKQGGARERGNLLDYVASHPNAEDRIEQANRYSDCFGRGQTRCELDQ